MYEINIIRGAANKAGSVKNIEINKNNKARYIMMNIQANNDIVDEISGLIKFNDSILRHVILQRKEIYTESSIMMKENSKREDTN